MGCGGVYPLAATLSAESSASKNDRAKLVALTFSMQGKNIFCADEINRLHFAFSRFQLTMLVSLQRCWLFCCSLFHMAIDIRF